MIKFNELRISSNRYLIIDVSVKNEDYYKDVYIKSVSVDTQDTYKDNGPSEARVYYQQFDSNTKTFRLELGIESIKVPLDTNMFFVYVEATGTPAADTPCGMDNKHSVAVAVNMRPVYNMAMSYLKELEGTCTTARGFIDMILRLKAFELSIKTGNFITAIKQWDKLFKNKRIVSPTKGCGCNGIYP